MVLKLLYLKKMNIQDEIIVGEIWGKNPYHEKDDR
jgi:hypothetical protein